MNRKEKPITSVQSFRAEPTLFFIRKALIMVIQEGLFALFLNLKALTYFSHMQNMIDVYFSRHSLKQSSNNYGLLK